MKSIRQCSVAGILGLGCVVAAIGIAPEGEVPPAKQLPCFPGAYYRKAVSSTDIWTGIQGVLVLPETTFDPKRKRPKNQAQFMDNPSVYIGGRAGEQEIDAGLTWEVVKLPNGKVSTDRRAFRPFWRNKGWFAGPADPDLYFYPGDTLKLKIETAAANKLTLTIELVERGPLGAAERAKYPETSPATQPTSAKPGVISVTFEAFGFGPGKAQEFKRVNAIDQVGREGKEVDPTTTKVSSAVWKSVSIMRGEKVLPFGPLRFTDMRCPAAGHFRVKPFGDSGEEIEIDGQEK